jgi:hypothetical protein
MNRQVDAYIDQLEEPLSETAALIRQLLLESVPGIEEKFSFKIPFYHYHGMFCYLNKTKEGLDLGFCRGKDLVMAFPQLDLRGRDMVASVLLTQPKDISKFSIPELIVAAAAWNEEAKRIRKSFLQKPGGRARK